MYIPKPFEVTDKSEITSCLQANAFGQLTSTVDGRLFSSHLPMLINDDLSVLTGHMARQNPQWNYIEGQEVLVTFSGPHDYISPSWYSSPGVPTWNYQVVHVYGTCTTFQDANRLGEVVNALTAKYESSFETPWHPDYKESMLEGIIGIEVTVTEIQCKYKLSQNFPAEDQTEVIKQLANTGSTQLSDAMKKNLMDSE